MRRSLLVAALSIALLCLASPALAAGHVAHYVAVLGGSGSLSLLCSFNLTIGGGGELVGACRARGAAYAAYAALVTLGACSRPAVEELPGGLLGVYASSNCSHTPVTVKLNLSRLLGVPIELNVTLPGSSLNGSGVEVYYSSLRRGGAVYSLNVTYEYSGGRAPARVSAVLESSRPARRLVLVVSRPRSTPLSELVSKVLAAALLGAAAGYILVKAQEVVRLYPAYVSLILWVVLELMLILSLLLHAPIP